MKLWAISDLHVGYDLNRQAVEECAGNPEDWLIVAGDIGETLEQFEWTFSTLAKRFARLFWVPGNHDLWCEPQDECRGVRRYETLVSLCRTHGVLTPEDPFATFLCRGTVHTIALLFTHYDYTFCPDDVTPDRAIAWAAEDGIECADEKWLATAPYANAIDWCRARVDYSRQRLDEIEGPTVLVNHYPLRRELAVLPSIPRFSVWCGTRQTENWHRDYRATVAVSGHLHLRSTQEISGTRFEEVSLGYPRQWNPSQSLASYLRLILDSE